MTSGHGIAGLPRNTCSRPPRGPSRGIEIGFKRFSTSFTDAGVMSEHAFSPSPEFNDFTQATATVRGPGASLVESELPPHPAIATTIAHATIAPALFVSERILPSFRRTLSRMHVSSPHPLGSERRVGSSSAGPSVAFAVSASNGH